MIAELKDKGIDYLTDQDTEENLNLRDGFRNYISVLHDLCAYNQMPLPLYEVKQEVGQGNDKEFTIVCTLGENVTYGYGRSKRAAKLNAAEEMWNVLKAYSEANNQEYVEN